MGKNGQYLGQLVLELSLRHIQWVDLLEENGLERLVRAVEHAVRGDG